MTARKGGRRADGESSIHQDAAGRWHGYVSMRTTHGGKADRRHVSGKTRAAVLKKVRELERRRDAGVVTAPGRLTVAEWLTHWLASIAPRRVRESTLTGYEVVVRRHLIPGIGHHPVDRLQPEHLEKLYDELLAKGLAPSYVLLCHRVLSRALKVAVRREKVGRNVAQLVDPPSTPEVDIESLKPAEARRLLTAARSERNAARWSVALSLGMRQGETLGLLWSAVDLGAGTLRVAEQLRRQVWRHGCGEPIPAPDPLAKPSWPCGRKRGADCPQRHGGGLVRVPPKSAKSRRSIALPWSPSCGRTARPRRRSGRRPASCGRNTGSSSVARPAGRSTPGRTGRRGRSSSAEPVYGTPGCMTLVTPPRLCSSPRASTSGSCRRSSATPQIRMTRHYTDVLPEVARDAANRMGAALWD